jgi:hypothetical protein
MLWATAIHSKSSSRKTVYVGFLGLNWAHDQTVQKNKRDTTFCIIALCSTVMRM